MDVKLSQKHLGLSTSMTLAIAAKAKEMKSKGINVIGFGVGEPDFNTPKNIIEKAKLAMDEGKTGYTAAAGAPELKKTIVKKLKEDNNLDYKESQIIVSNGAKHSIYNSLQAICNPGDEVIIGNPYWVSYPELIKMAEAVPVLIDCPEENEFKINPEDLKNKVTDKTKCIILNSPANPTGSVYTREELEAIAKIAVDNNIIVISDEIYEKLIYDNEEHISIASLNEKIKDLTIVVNGLSKGYAMTGWRIGYTASHESISKIMSNIQSHATSNPNTIAQYASIEALEGDQTSIEDMRKEFDARRKFMVDKINSIDNLSCICPKGAFYVMINIEKLIGKTIKGKEIQGSLDITELILEHGEVAVVPGIAFGVDKFIRLSYANSLDNIKEGLNRIDKVING